LLLLKVFEHVYDSGCFVVCFVFVMLSVWLPLCCQV
jgi:hypothetical protein